MSTRDKLWESGRDESVDVNQRALIDKVLARYSGEFTVFRELLQNSDDAQSQVVEILFQTQDFIEGTSLLGTDSQVKGLPNLETTPVHQWIFKNNGVVFTNEDWSRLKKIAEGNPDEQKIGAFGVGFYSLFSITEEPFVKSGDQWMGFYWKDKKDQLFARRGNLDDSDPSSWTSFEMVLREPAPIPTAFDLARFLTSSITFMTHLQEISVYFNDWCLLKLKKAVGIQQSHQIPQGLSLTSPNKFMSVINLREIPVTIQATIMNWVYISSTKLQKRLPPKPLKAAASGFFSSWFGSLTGPSAPQKQMVSPPVPAPTIDPLETSETSIILSVFSADINVKLDSKLSSEIHRSTKKKPPSTMKYELIYTAKDKYDASKQEEAKYPHATGSVFQGLRADLQGLGSTRIFIGHATAQTTGIGGHMAARFIPTVEREAIDFMDRHVAVWNRELIYVGGLLSRAAYQIELETVRKTWEANADLFQGIILPELQTSLTGRATHALKFFTFHPSTPSAEVSDLLKMAFFNCGPSNRLPLVSNLGIRDAPKIRSPDPSITFLKRLPLIPDELSSEPMVKSLRDMGIIKDVTFEDVLDELRARPLPEDDMVACIKWWISKYDTISKYDISNIPDLTSVRKQLIDAAVLSMSSTPGNEKVIPLHSIKTVLNQKHLNGIPSDGPLPIHLLPISITKHFPLDDLKRACTWTDLTMTDWLDHMCDPAVAGINPAYDIESSPHWAEKVLLFVARNWGHGLSLSVKQHVINLLKAKTCIPTSSGMKRPDESYFSSADIFHDLPTVKLPSGTSVKGSMERLLQDLEVRKHVQLQIIFDRMIKTNEWTISDLTSYLVSVKSSLKEEETRRLRLTAAFPKEQSGASSDGPLKPRRFKADQLYEPLPLFRQLELPIIDWGAQPKWRSNSDEAQFLFDLGLRRYPPLQELIQLCMNPNAEVRSTALRYLIDNLRTKYSHYNADDYQDSEFIPALDGTRSCLGSPRQVFSKSEWSHLGFLVIDPGLQADSVKLQIKEHPTTSQLVALLETKPPDSLEQGRKWFGTISTRVSEFSRSELSKLSETQFIPVNTLAGMIGPTMRWVLPTQCYLGRQSKEKFHSKLFIFVDFGQAGNAFLTACGARQEPSVEELAKILLDDPHRFYELAQGPLSFLNEIRNIAVNRKNLSAGTMARMKRAPVLLCSRRKHAEQVQSMNSAGGEPDDDEWEVCYDLNTADRIVIADDTNAHRVFGADLLTAPQEDIIEAFYMELGARRLSSLVKEEYLLGGEIPNSKRARDTRSLILERLPIFLHEHNHAHMKVSLDWLQAETNFHVRSYGHIKVKKMLNHGKLQLERKQEASAVAKRSASQRIDLSLADNAETDMYEVALCLIRFIFEHPKAHDALLFMTILSTDLKALKRRGFNVDRILRQRKLAQQAEETRKSEGNVNLTPQISSKVKEVASLSSTSSASISDVHEPSNKPSSFSDALQKLKQKVGVTGNQVSNNQGLNTAHKPEEQSMSHARNSSSEPLMPGGMPSGPFSGPRTRPLKGQESLPVTSLQNIASNIDMAMRSCRAESSNLLQNRQEMRHVKESNNDGYCDISGHAQNMRLVGSVGQVKIFVGQEVPSDEGKSLITKKSGAISRFIGIMGSLAHVYTLNLTNLHLFYDMGGVLIAFNRNGSIFLNLRYYEAWHDAGVQQGRIEDALISWYFTIAHEIAHNLVQPHNSEHEFYFSAICEKHLVSLSQLLVENGK